MKLNAKYELTDSPRRLRLKATQKFGTGPTSVWTCGQNAYCELGHHDTDGRKVPVRVSDLARQDAIAVAAGNEHTIVLTAQGNLLSVGYNDSGQCGQGNTGRVERFTQIDELSGRGVRLVVAFNGCEHTMVTTADGKLFTFGKNDRGQVGLGVGAGALYTVWNMHIMHSTVSTSRPSPGD